MTPCQAPFNSHYKINVINFTEFELTSIVSGIGFQAINVTLL